MCTHTHTHTHTHTPKSHLCSVTSSKDLITVTAFRMAAVTEGGLLSTVSFCILWSVVHFKRQASTADGRVTICKKMGSHACHDVPYTHKSVK